MIKRWATKLAAGALVATAALGAGSAQAGTYSSFGWDIDNIKTTNLDHNGGANAFGINFTGALKLEWRGGANPTQLFKFKLDGAAVSNTTGFDVTAYIATIHFVGGDITGGSVALTVSNGSVSDTFSADFKATTDAISFNQNNGYSVTAALKNGAFGGDSLVSDLFATYDVSNFIDAQGTFGRLFGSFFEFEYSGAEVDFNTGVQMLVVIPAPPAVLWGLAGLGGLVLGRKRLRSLGLSKR